MRIPSFFLLLAAVFAATRFMNNGMPYGFAGCLAFVVVVLLVERREQKAR